MQYDGLTCPRYVIGLRLPFVHREPPVEFVLDTGADVSLYPREAADAQGLVYERRQTTDKDLPTTIRGRLTGQLVEVKARLLVEPNGGDRIDVRFTLPLFLYDSPPADPPARPNGSAAAVPADEHEWAARQEELLRGSGRPATDSGIQRPVVLGSLGFFTRFRSLLTPNWLVLATDDQSLDRAVALVRTPAPLESGSSLFARAMRRFRGQE